MPEPGSGSVITCLRRQTVRALFRDTVWLSPALQEQNFPALNLTTPRRAPCNPCGAVVVKEPPHRALVRV